MVTSEKCQTRKWHYVDLLVRIWQIDLNIKGSRTVDQNYRISGVHTRIPAVPHELTDRITPVEKSIVLCHLGVPDIETDQWRLTIDGMVERPAVLTFGQLKQFPFCELQSFHQCAGSPLNPHQPTRRICNVIWGGARLKDVLANSRVLPGATFLWSSGSDGGMLADTVCPTYMKDLPIDRIGQDVLIAYEMNGKPLLPEHGYPARLVVPGYYGTNSVKWLRRLELSSTRASGPFTTKWYNDPLYGADGTPTGETQPVWAVAPQSIIVCPAPAATITAGRTYEIWGWAWADEGVDQVVLSTDGLSWFETVVEKQAERGWQRFSMDWAAPHRGKFSIMSRARSCGGIVQPLAQRRNAIFSIEIEAI
jgi:DMSO/TMAO reductase YedYZ molybdopterin-dependent catalytic subunit